MPKISDHCRLALSYLDEVADTLGWIFYRGPGHLSGIGRVRGGFQRIPKSYLSLEGQKHLAYLKNRGWVKMRERADRLVISLTDEGFVALLRNKIRAGKPNKSKNNLCIVIFDIPEQFKTARVLLRRFLQECGFTYLQKSVWISHRDVASLLVELVRRQKLTPWVHVLTGTL